LISSLSTGLPASVLLAGFFFVGMLSMGSSLLFLPIGGFPNGSESVGRLRMQQDELPYFESAEDALRAAVQALGGAKRVGALLWPDKTPDHAGRHLLDCINVGRAEKLSLSQAMRVLALAKDAGCHAPMLWICGEIGYDARPVTNAEEVDRITSVVEQSTKTLANAIATLERLQRVRGVA
jgi:hypothetical protein